MKSKSYARIASGLAVAAATGAALYLGATRPARIADRVPEPARPVDLDRYLGRWYEIARHENRFENGLDAVTADYRLRPDGKIGIVNAGRKGGPAGKASHVHGRAIVVDNVSNAKLKVSFFGPFYVGTYWVLDHGDAYDWSIVGEPSGRYLWLLARSADLSPDEIETLLGRVADLGYDRSQLRMTRHA
jgi:apolipoprotein D and lipocalin family protein